MQFELHFDSLTRTRVIYYSTVAWFILLLIPYIIRFYLSYRGINLIYIFYHLLCLGNYSKYNNNNNNENNLCLSHKSCQVVGWRYVGWMGKGRGGTVSRDFLYLDLSDTLHVRSQRMTRLPPTASPFFFLPYYINQLRFAGLQLFLGLRCVWVA